MGTGKTYSTKYIIDNDGNKGAAGQILTSTDKGINFQDAEKNGPNQIKGAIFDSKVVLIDTPNGGLKPYRVITDEYGEWIQVGRFAANAKTTVQSVWSSVSGLSTGTSQSETTEFSADFGDCFPDEVRIMGATDFNNWRNTRTIDFVYKVPAGRKWKHFFSNGDTTTMGIVDTVKYGWTVNGAYDGFGRWTNPDLVSIRMSDTTNPVLNPPAAYTTATANAFNWETNSDAKFAVHATRTFCGQDTNVTSGFGNDDGIEGFFDEYPSETNNMQGGSDFSSAVWVLIKIPGGASGGGSGTYWAENGTDIYNTNSRFVGIGTTTPNAKLEVATSSNVNSYSDGAIQVVSSSPIAFTAASNLNPSLNRWGFTLREGGEGHFGIRDYRHSQTRVTIDNDGNLGIGTTSPNAKLHIAGGSSGMFLSNLGDNSAYDSIKMSYTGYNSGTPEFIFTQTSTPGSGVANTWYRFKNTNGNLGANPNNVANVTIGGKLGIGSDNPSKRLGVEGSVQLGRNGNNYPGDPNITLISGHGIEDSSTGNFYGSYGFLEFNSNTNYTGSARRFALTNGFLANKFAILRSDTGMASMVLGVAGAEPSGATADFVINPNGFIGIGTTDPNEKLEVNGILQIKRSGDHPAIRFQEDSTTLGYMGSGDWAINGLTNGDFGISSASTGSLVLGTNSGSGRMYLIDGGKIGIGVSEPLAGLEISNEASSVYQQWSYDHPGANNYNLQLSETVTSGNVRYVFDQKNAGTVYSDVLVFNQGEIGIGTDEPDGKLNISKGTASGISDLLVLTNHQYADADNSGSSIRFQGYNLFNPGSSNPRYSEIIGVNGGNSVPKRIDFKFHADTDIKTPLSILQSGKVGIGTTSPANLVELRSDSGGTILRLRNRDGALTNAGDVQNSIVMNGRYWSGANTDFVETRINSVHQLANGNGGSALTFMTQTGGSAPTEKVRIDRDGKVGIGTTDPSFQLSIENHDTDTSTATLELDGKRTNGTDGPVGEMIFSNNGDTFATVAGYRDNADNKGSLQFQTQDSSFATRMTISSEGNVGIGVTNPADGLLQVSQNSSQWMGYFYNTSTSGIGAHIETNSSGTQQVLRVSSIFGGSNNAGFRVLANGNAYFGRNSSAPSQELSTSATPTNFGKYTSEIRLIKTPNGGLQKCRVITDNYGEWVLVGRFASNAMNEIQGTWSSVSGLSTSTSQSETTQFSADFGNSYPTEVRIMGATDFTKWRDTRTIDFIYGVPAGRLWKHFFSGGADSGMASVGPNHSGNNKFGWNINGSYDGFGRWINPSQTSVGMSDGNVTNPSSAYTTATANAFNWEGAADAKITVSATRTYSGQDSFEHAGFGNDDGINGFFDEYPTETNNMQGGQDFSSAVWVLIKLPKSDSGGGSQGPYLPLSAGSTYSLSGELFINAGAGISVEGTSNDLYFLQGKRTGNSGPTFSVYDNASTAYLNSYASMAFRANQHGGSGGNFTFTGGNVGIGTSSPGTGLYISGDSANWNTTQPGTAVGTIHLDPGVATDHFGNAITFGASDTANGSNAQAGIYVRSDGSYGTKMYFATTDSYAVGSKTSMWLDHSGNLRVKGDVIAFYSSDKRFKDNLVKINNPLVKINKLSGYYFNWNDKQDTYEKGSKDIGIIAQEIEGVLPEIVQTRENGYKAVNYQKIVALLIEGMKEQQETIDKLEDRIKKLENK